MSAFDMGGSEERPSAAAPYRRIAVLGAGSWGTALAVIAAKAGRGVTLWARREDHARALKEDGRNARYLPEVTIPDSIRVTSDMAAAIEDADAVLMVVPSSAVRETSKALAAILDPKIPVILAAKGIEPVSGLLMSDVAAEELKGNPMGALSGPNFANEAALGDPTACTIASNDDFEVAPETTVAARMAVAMGTESFRPYISDDLVGVEVGGALKNVIAIACGIATGAGFGANTRAALITRGISELARLGVAKGAKPETLMGLSGMGDLTLTCNSMQSRNFSLGVALGQGEALEDILRVRKAVTEGVYTARSVCKLADSLSVDMPICAAVDEILNKGADINQVVDSLLARPFKEEM